MGDIDSILAVFTEDAVFDLSGIGLSAMLGHDGIRDFHTNVYANTAHMAHMAHYLSNFAVTAYTGQTASIRAYVNGIGLGKHGRGVIVYGRYYFDVIRTAAGWKSHALCHRLPDAAQRDTGQRALTGVMPDVTRECLRAVPATPISGRRLRASWPISSPNVASPA